MIPFKDENPTRTVPVFVLVIIAANVIVQFYQWSLPPLAQRQWVFAWSVVPAVLTHGVQSVGSMPAGPPPGYPAWVTIFTAMFMHGGLLHLGGNMLYLWIFGNNIEDSLGHIRFLAFYLASGVAASLLQTAVNPASPIPTLGASGAIAGVLGAYAVRYPTARVYTLVLMPFLLQVVRLPALWVLGFWFILQLIPGTLSLGLPSAGGIAYFAHIGGFVAGMVFIRVLEPRRRRPRLPGEWQA